MKLCEPVTCSTINSAPPNELTNQAFLEEGSSPVGSLFGGLDIAERVEKPFAELLAGERILMDVD